MRNPSPSRTPQPPPPAASCSDNNNNKKTTPCCSKVGLKRGPWTPEEDELLASYIKREGEGRWRTLPKKAGLLRCGKSCRLRWMNYLRPSVKRGHIAPDEEDLILRLHRLLGNRWALIAGRIPGRTDNEIKNYWNTHLSKKLISQGIDPRTHKPLLQNNINNKPNHDHDNNLAASHHHHHQHHQHHHNDQDPSPSAGTIMIKSDTRRNASASFNNNVDPFGGINEFNSDHDQNQDPDEATKVFHEKGTDDDQNMQMINGEEDVYGMDLRNSHEGLSNEDADLELDDDIDYNCSDDVFSSFLNSLINDEDAFNTTPNLNVQQHEPLIHSNTNNNATDSSSCDDILISSNNTAFTFGPGWDAPDHVLPTSTSSFDPNDTKSGADQEQAENQL